MQIKESFMQIKALIEDKIDKYYITIINKKEKTTIFSFLFLITYFILLNYFTILAIRFNASSTFLSVAKAVSLT